MLSSAQTKYILLMALGYREHPRSTSTGGQVIGLVVVALGGELGRIMLITHTHPQQHSHFAGITGTGGTRGTRAQCSTRQTCMPPPSQVGLVADQLKMDGFTCFPCVDAVLLPKPLTLGRRM